MKSLYLCCALISFSVWANPSQSFDRLKSAFSEAERMTLADLERVSHASGECYVKKYQFHFTGEYRYEDSGTRYRAAKRIPIYRLESRYAAGSAVLVTVPRHRSGMNVIVDLDNPHGALTRATLLIDQPLRHQNNWTVLNDNGLFLTTRIYSHWGRFVDTARFFEWGFEVKSTVRLGAERKWLVKQTCQLGVCPTGVSSPAGHVASYSHREEIRYCELTPQ